MFACCGEACALQLSWLVSLCGGQVGLFCPIAPASFVELRAFDSSELERDEIVAGGDSASAIDDDVAVLRRAERLVLFPELVGGEEDAVLQVLGPRCVDCAGDVTGACVDRLEVAAVTLARASIEEMRSMIPARRRRRTKVRKLPKDALALES